MKIPNKTIHIEDAVALTLERRFKSEIPVTVPDCYADLLPRVIDAGGQGNQVLFAKTGKIEMIEANTLAGELVKRKVKTLGLLAPCEFKMFTHEKLDYIKKEITAEFQNYQPGAENVNNIIDSFVFESGKRYFAYISVLPAHLKRQIEASFEPFFKAGGAVVSVQDRYLPVTRFAMEILPESIESSTLFCEISGHEVRVWVVIDYKNGIFSPLAADSGHGLSSLEFLLDSVVAQTSKQYRLGIPTSAILIDGRDGADPDLEKVSNERVKELIAAYCEKIVEMGKEASRHASLNGARLLVAPAAESGKKKNENDTLRARQIPRVNITSREWAYNYLIPITLREFYRKGMGFIAGLALFMLICGGAYGFVGSFRSGYEQEINRLQSDTTKLLREYAVLKERSEEFSQLGHWKNNPDIAAQYSAIASVLTRSNCLLVQAAFHSKFQDMPSKAAEEIRPEIERLTKSAIGALDIAGIWELSFRLPTTGISTNDTRKNTIAALQKDAASVFSTGPRDAAAPKSLLLLNEDQGQNTMNLLKNENGMNAVLLVWNAGRRQ